MSQPQSQAERFSPQDLVNPDGTLNAAKVSAALRYIFDVFNELRPTKDGPHAKRYVSVDNPEGFSYYIWVDVKGHLRYFNKPPTVDGDESGTIII